MDILIPLGNGSRWDDNELRYCLRSIEKNLRGVGNIFIVGRKPSWLQSCFFIPFDDIPGAPNRDFNIYRKIIAGCHEPCLSSSFLFMNDDHFLLQEFYSPLFPDFYEGTYQDKYQNYDSGQPYKKVIQNGLKLIQNGDLWYDIHCPIIYSKENFLQLPGEDAWPSYGFPIKSLYGNMFLDPRDAEYCPDLKFREKLIKESIYEVLKDRLFFSIGDRCLHGEMKIVLEELYPIKSKYEI